MKSKKMMKNNSKFKKNMISFIQMKSEFNSVVKSNIKKPYTDTRDYKAFTLDNGLEILYISSESNKTLVSFSINSGSHNNPKEVLGLAHLIEHMHFLGCEKYKEPNYLDSVLTMSSGMNNA